MKCGVIAGVQCEYEGGGSLFGDEEAWGSVEQTMRVGMYVLNVAGAKIHYMYAATHRCYSSYVQDSTI